MTVGGQYLVYFLMNVSEDMNAVGMGRWSPLIFMFVFMFESVNSARRLDTVNVGYQKTNVKLPRVVVGAANHEGITDFVQCVRIKSNVTMYSFIPALYKTCRWFFIELKMPPTAAPTI